MECLTSEYLASQIVDTQYLQPVGTLTLCILTMANGLHVTGKSACLNPVKFDEAIGQTLAFNDAFNKLWELEGYACACDAMHIADAMLSDSSGGTD